MGKNTRKETGRQTGDGKNAQIRVSYDPGDAQGRAGDGLKPPGIGQEIPHRHKKTRNA